MPWKPNLPQLLRIPSLPTPPPTTAGWRSGQPSPAAFSFISFTSCRPSSSPVLERRLLGILQTPLYTSSLPIDSLLTLFIFVILLHWLYFFGQKWGLWMEILLLFGGILIILLSCEQFFSLWCVIVGWSWCILVLFCGMRIVTLCLRYMWWCVIRGILKWVDSWVALVLIKAYQWVILNLCSYEVK